MKEKVERSILIRDDDPILQGSTLVVGIDKKGHIIRFNDALEHLTGSSKNDVLDIPFASYFSRQIPQEELQKLIQQARHTPDEVDVDTSFQTVHGDNVVVSWSGFAVKNDEDGQVSQLNLVGTPHKSQEKNSLLLSAQSKKSKTTKKLSQTKKTGSTNKPNSKINKSKTSKTDKPSDLKTTETSNAENESSPKKTSNQSTKKSSTKRKMSIRKKPKKTKNTSKKPSSKNNTISKKKDSTKKPEKKKRSIKIKRRSKPLKSKIKKDEEDNIQEQVVAKKIQDDEITENGEKREKHSFKKLIPKPILPSRKSKKEFKEVTSPPLKSGLFSKIKKSTSQQKTDEMNKAFEKRVKKLTTQLKKENDQLKKQNTLLEKKLKDAELKREEFKSFFNDRLRFIRDSVGIAKKREEFKQMMHQLTDRKQKLEQLETDMVLEKKEFKQKIEEFVTWREKLETLEQEIEKRRQFLSEQERFLNEQYDKVLSHELSQPASYIKKVEEEHDSEEPEYDSGLIEKEDLFNSLTVEAAVLQRGRIKKINTLFAEMLGFSEKDLIGKHLVDFVTPLGLEGVEHHYMNRLKGVDDSSYQTVFLSKTKDEIPVKVNIKNTDFHGERAEIVTFNEI